MYRQKRAYVLSIEVLWLAMKTSIMHAYDAPRAIFIFSHKLLSAFSPTRSTFNNDYLG